MLLRSRLLPILFQTILFQSLVCIQCTALYAQSPWLADREESGGGAGRSSVLNSQEIEQRFAQLEAELRQLKSQNSVLPAGGSTYATQDLSIQQAAYGTCTDDTSTGCTGFHLRHPTDDFPEVKLSGFIQIDAARFNQSATSIATVGDVNDGADFRRARLAAVGHVAENVGFMVEFDFAFPGRPSFMDVWMELEDLPVLGNLRIGQWRQPFGMDELTSVKELTFLERGLPFAMAPFRQIGIGVHDSYEDTGTTWAVSAFRFPTGPFGGNSGDAGGVSLASRITTLAYEDESTKSLLHLGADFSFIDPSNDSSQFRSTPDVFVSVAPNPIPFFANTNAIPTNSISLFNLETGFRRGSLSGQAEWRLAHVAQSGGPALNFQSAYGQISYLLTGEVRSYNRKNGVFGRIVPDRPFKPGSGWGAWETAAKLSWLDLDDNNINGNRLTDATLGLNWYLNKRTKFQFNYVYSLLDGAAIARSNTNVVAARAQIDF